MSSNRQWLIVGAIVGLIAVLIGAGWLVRDRFAPVEVGSAAPGFTAVDMDGQPVSLEELRGEVVLLNIWATWCGPCREEMPSIQRLHDELGPKGLRIVAVSIDAEQGGVDRSGNPGGDIEAFARAYDLTFPIWHDPAGNITRTYRATGVPESFVIDRSGTIISKVIGPTEWDSPERKSLFLRLLEG